MTLTVTTQATASTQANTDTSETQLQAASEDVAYFDSLMEDSQVSISSDESMPATMADFVTSMTISNMSKNPFLKDIAKELENN